MKVISLLLIIILTGCNFQVKDLKVSVEAYDYSKITKNNLLKINSNKLDEEYGIINKNYLVNNYQDNYCKTINNSMVTPYYSVYTQEDYTSMDIYYQKDKSCLKQTKLTNLYETGVATIFNNSLYVSTLVDETKSINKSGVLKLENKTFKNITNNDQLALNMSSSKDYLIILENNTLKIYDKNDKLHHEIKDSKINNFFILKDKLYTMKKINEKTDELENITCDYLIEIYDLKNIKKDKVIQKIELNNVNQDINSITMNDKYLNFKGINSIVCDLEFSKCLSYDYNVLLKGDYQLIGQASEDDDQIIFLSKFNDYQVEDLLNTANLAWEFNNKDLSFYLENNDYENIKYKKITFQLK